MTHPVLEAHGTFEGMKLGKAPKKDDRRTLKLAKYIDEAVVLPQVPDACDWTHAVTGWPMYKNDQYGDCTCAAVGHMIQAWSAAIGNPKTPSDTDVFTAYIPGTGNDDSGRAEIDVLNYWRQTGVGGDKIEAYAAIDPSNLEMVKAAIYLFGGVYTGIELPQTAQGQSVWDVVSAPPQSNEPGSWGGHAVPYEAYGGGQFTCITWGHPLQLTEAFHKEYTDEVYAIISTDFLTNNKTPEGFSIDDLRADLLACMQ